MVFKPFVIGVSGKIGSGKNYLSEQIAKELELRGFTTKETAYGNALKNEMTDILNFFRTEEEDFSGFSEKMNISVEKLEELQWMVQEDLLENINLTGFDRSDGIRKALQHLGTNIRRKQLDNYWVEKITDSFSNVDFMLITDIRFPNEADKVHALNGYLLRLNIPFETILDRIKQRDSLAYSPEAFTHPSELALDDYFMYNEIVGETFNAEEIVDRIVSAKIEKENDETR